MAYFSLHAYDADVWIREFRGLDQSDVSMNPDVRNAAEEWNAETPLGVLQPKAADTLLGGEHEDFEEHRVETIARFYRRWYNGPGSKSWLVCAVNGKLYYRQEEERGEWEPIDLPDGVDAFVSNVWSWVTYEESIQGVDHPIDIVIMSNADDGMIKVVPPDRPQIWNDFVTHGTTWGDLGQGTWLDARTMDWTCETISTSPATGEPDYKFAVIERYAERIWGGGLRDNPDMLVYSRPYHADDWTEAGPNELPQDCAGSIQQPSWDGDSFTALRAFGDQLIAFKEHRIWRIMGTNPGEFAFTQQYGGGAPYFNTIAVDIERIYMADTDGLNIYDGMSVAPWMREQIRELWRTVNRDALDQMCAALFQRRYYLAFPTGDSTVNNAMLVYDLNEGTILFYKNIYIESLMATPDNLYATSSTVPGKVIRINYDSWVTGKASGAATRWVSPWMDFGYKRIQKGGFELYITPEVQDEPVDLIVTIETEKKAKTKTYTVQPTEKEHRNKRLHFGGSGRKFRIIIETTEGVTAPWRLLGGIQIIAETDSD